MKNTQGLKILLLSDNQGWIVDRISQKIKEMVPHDITIDSYQSYDPEKLKNSGYDLIHFNNTDIGRFKDVLKDVKTPMIMSVRSFRYPVVAVELSQYMTAIHVIHPELKEHFKDSIYIADAIFEGFEPKPFKVGMAIQNTDWSKEYKGYNLVKTACDELGCEFIPALDIPPAKMREYYESINLYVCASINEGFGTPVVECMSLNIPVLTTNVGIAKYFNVAKCDRTVGSIKEGILRFYTYPLVKKFNWEVVGSAFNQLYEGIYEETKHTQ